MTYTRHGHHIPGTVMDGKPDKVATCGGPGLCPECSQQASLNVGPMHNPPVNNTIAVEMTRFVEISPEAFTDGNVISYQGFNYYRSCGVPVVSYPDGSGSTCVKRVGHEKVLTDHEDYDGVIKGL